MASAMRSFAGWAHGNAVPHVMWQSVIPLQRTCAYVSDGALSANSGRKYPKNAVKTKFLKSFPRPEYVPHKSPLPREPGASVHRRAFVSSLRLQPLAAHAVPRWPGATGMVSASAVRRDVGIAPYESLDDARKRGGRATARVAPTGCIQEVRWGGPMQLHNVMFI